jgi:predicted transcriptional regulator
MPKSNKVEIGPEISELRDEDDATLAAIDEGVGDAEAGRTVPAEKVRTRLPKWITPRLHAKSDKRSRGDYRIYCGR